MNALMLIDGYTYYGMTQGTRSNSANHFLKLVGVDA